MTVGRPGGGWWGSLVLRNRAEPKTSLSGSVLLEMLGESCLGKGTSRHCKQGALKYLVSVPNLFDLCCLTQLVHFASSFSLCLALFTILCDLPPLPTISQKGRERLGQDQQPIILT